MQGVKRHLRLAAAKERMSEGRRGAKGCKGRARSMRPTQIVVSTSSFCGVTLVLLAMNLHNRR